MQRHMQRLWLDGAIEEGIHRERKEIMTYLTFSKTCASYL
jgi:hypothetical protein